MGVGTSSSYLHLPVRPPWPAPRSQNPPISLNRLLAFTVHMNAATVSTSLTSSSRKCRSATAASMPSTSPRSLYTGGGPGIRSSSTSRELRRRPAPGSRRGRLAAVAFTPGPGLAVDVRRRACPCGSSCVLGFSRDEGGPGSSALSGDGSSAGIKSKHARYRCRASDGSVAKSTCTFGRVVSAMCHRQCQHHCQGKNPLEAEAQAVMQETRATPDMVYQGDRAPHRTSGPRW